MPTIIISLIYFFMYKQVFNKAQLSLQIFYIQILVTVLVNSSRALVFMSHLCLPCWRKLALGSHTAGAVQYLHLTL